MKSGRWDGLRSLQAMHEILEESTVYSRSASMSMSHGTISRIRQPVGTVPVVAATNGEVDDGR